MHGDLYRDKDVDWIYGEVVLSVSMREIQAYAVHIREDEKMWA